MKDVIDKGKTSGNQVENPVSRENNRHTKNRGNNPFFSKPPPIGSIELAIKENRSMLASAESLNMSYQTFKKYATMYDLWNPQSKNAHTFKRHKPKVSGWNGKTELGRSVEWKNRYIKEAMLIEECSACGFDDTKAETERVPLIVHHIDHDYSNNIPDNIKLFCYNCYFIYSSKDYNNIPLFKKREVSNFSDIVGEAFSIEDIESSL
jgi:ribosomal protein L44E